MANYDVEESGRMKESIVENDNLKFKMVVQDLKNDLGFRSKI